MTFDATAAKGRRELEELRVTFSLVDSNGDAQILYNDQVIDAINWTSSTAAKFEAF